MMRNGAAALRRVLQRALRGARGALRPGDRRGERGKRVWPSCGVAWHTPARAE